MKPHTTCLTCGQTFGQHNPDDPDGCDIWHPTACTTCPDHKA